VGVNIYESRVQASENLMRAGESADPREWRECKSEDAMRVESVRESL
jgi:hypothetical protein